MVMKIAVDMNTVECQRRGAERTLYYVITAQETDAPQA